MTMTLSGTTGGASAAANGYTWLPNNILIQWGSVTMTSSGAVTFPTAFPNNCFSMTASGSYSGGADYAFNISALSKTAATISHSGSISQTVYWIAIGN